MRTRLLLPLVVAAFFLPTGRVAAEASTPVELHALGKAPVKGTLAGLNDGVQLVDAAKVPWSHVLSLSFPGHRASLRKDPTWRVWLNGGEQIRGLLRGPALDGDGIALSVLGVGDIEIPLERINSLEFVKARAGDCYGLLASHPVIEDEDVAYDARKDALRGTVVRITQTHVEMEDNRENERAVSWDQLRVLHLSNDPAEPAKGGWAEIELLDGTRFASMAAPTLVKEHLEFRTRSLEAKLRVALSQVSVVRWNGSAFVRASSLPFESTIKTQTDDHPDVGVNAILHRLMRVRVDQRAKMDGADVLCPLRVAGRTYRYGFAVHSFTALTIQLDKKYKSLQTGVGIDDEVLETPGHVGNASARILGDGKVLWQKASIKGGTDLTTVGPLDVSDVTTLTLEVGFGPDGIFAMDRVDWIDPILVRK